MGLFAREIMCHTEMWTFTFTSHWTESDWVRCTDQLSSFQSMQCKDGFEVLYISVTCLVDRIELVALTS